MVQKHQFFGAQPWLWSNSHIQTWLLEKPKLCLYRSLLAKWSLCFFLLWSLCRAPSAWLLHVCPPYYSISCVVQSLSCVQLFVIPWTAACQASLSFAISRSLLKFLSVESVKPSNHLILCHSLLLLSSIFPSIRVFFSESAIHIRWLKYGTFSFRISPSNEYSGLMAFRTDWFDLLAAKELSRIFPNTMVQKHQFFGVQSSLWSSSHIHTWLLEKS